MYLDTPLGRFGQLAATSFHETKNIVSGEGGALFVNDPRFAGRAEILREKGTDRSRFLRGQTDKYTWVDVGSSFLPGELTAAFLAAQMEHAEEIKAHRLQIWSWYYDRLERLEASGRLRRPIVSPGCAHNAHMFYVLVLDAASRTRVISELNAQGINAVFHYVPLHSSPAGQALGRVHGSMRQTDALSGRLVRLPLWIGLQHADCDRVVDSPASRRPAIRSRIASGERASSYMASSGRCVVCSNMYCPDIAACITWSEKQIHVVPGAKRTSRCGEFDW